MKIKSLKVWVNDNEYFYEFQEKTMIYSKNNSRGKTTLVRFILYALGYQIPATEGVGEFDNMKFEILVNSNEQDFKIYRTGNNVVIFEKENKFEFVLPQQENEMHCMVFNIDNVTILNNLLAVFYFDQEKGWTLLNRGKIIGNIRFNIEEFIAGISNISIQELLDEKKILNREIKKYRYVKNAIDINNEFGDEEDDTIEEFEKNSMNELIQLQKEKQIELRKIKNEISRLDGILRKNNEFANMIENYGLLVKYNEEKFILSKDNLCDFEINQDLMKTKIKSLKLEVGKLNNELDKIINQINSKNTLFQTEDLLENMQKNIESLGIDISQIDKVIRQLENKRNKINKDIKNKLLFNNTQLTEYYNTIFNYAVELNINNYISDNSPKYVLTNKLKGLSGRILAQMSFIFRLSYIKAIENKFNIYLPIIMDSPRTNELSEDSTNKMMEILKRDFSKHQIITASIYLNDIIDFKLLNLEEGLFNEKFLKE